MVKMEGKKITKTKPSLNKELERTNIQLAFIPSNRSQVCWYVLVQDAWPHFLFPHFTYFWVAPSLPNAGSTRVHLFGH